MSLGHGASVVTANLVFYFDSANVQKSWKGAPATNFFTNGHFSGGNGISQESGSNATNEVIVFRNPGNSEYVLRQTGTVASTEYQINLTTQLAASTTYVMSGWYAESLNYSSADGSRMFHSRAFSASGAHVATGNGIGTVLETKVLNGITWRYCYATITTPADYSNSFNWYLGYGGSAYTGHRYYTDIQMEVGSLPSRFINGTRSNTQAILDLTKRNTITATSLAYASNGAFSFNGSSSEITASANASSLGISNDLTISIFTRRAASPTNELQGQAGFGAGGSISFKNSSNFFADVFSTTPTRYTVRTAPGDSIAAYANVWVNLCVTVSGTTVKTYFNGDLSTTQVMDSTIKNFASEVFGIAAGYGYYRAQGDVPVASVYNRALTDNEVRQNFNAMRGRYGI